MIAVTEFTRAPKSTCIRLVRSEAAAAMLRGLAITPTQELEIKAVTASDPVILPILLTLAIMHAGATTVANLWLPGALLEIVNAIPELTIASILL